VEVSGELQASSSLFKPVLIEKEGGWGEQVWAFWGKREYLASVDIESPDRPAHSLVFFSDWVLRIDTNEQCKLYKR